MRRWFRKLIQNSFFQVGAGLFIVMMLGGFIIKYLESGSITEKESPFWWAIVTMTTVGYGDFSPSTPEGRLFAVFIMFAGIALVSLLTASISSIYVAKRIREDKGLEKVNLNDHIVLCGWNENAESIIDSLRNLSEKNSLHLILVNEIHEDIVNHLRNKYKDIDLYFVAGDFTSEEILKRASIEEAHTVIIIPNIDDEKIGSPDEKTIFATLTIKSMSSTVRVVAYLMHRENLTHIRRANVDEVVLSDDFGAYMLASHVMDPGIPQTTKGLLNASSDERLRRVDIPSQFVGRSFDDLFEYFRSTNGWILVGMYSEEENLGIGEVLSADSSALDAFIERKLNEGGISLQEESKVTTVINPKNNFLIEEGQRAIVIP
ncbi:MAG: ion channel [Candidatus Neomarinimicrobiota bacterium]|nr:ion channel [Candidatus Neomarinimicrobiota bacterium]MED5255637.1 ion channel [Candidatus Neomarinimicrobiota bacterium]MED5266709.1 ion channel [Candidatus Neomarinimicrobiota bacterium]|tara:strand:+ start:1372 stop:2496 length:1125 start_codon:yes stop_codon:yes gene_type:complete